MKAAGRITGPVANEALSRLNVDEFGLDDMDARILTTIIEKFGGGPVGLGTVAVAVGEDPDTLQDVYEPYLIQQGFLERTQRGRCATALRVQAVRSHASSAADDDLWWLIVRWCCADFDYALPPELIAQEPVGVRGESRLLAG